MRRVLVVAFVALSLAFLTRSGSAQKPGSPQADEPNREAVAKGKAAPKLGKLTTTGGSILDGTILTETIRVKCDLGELDIPFWQVMAVVNQQHPDAAGRAALPTKWLTYGDVKYISEYSEPVPVRSADSPPKTPPFKIAVVTESGDAILAGEIMTKEFQFSCGFGVLTVPWERVALIDFVQRAEPVEAPAMPAKVMPAPVVPHLAPYHR